ncbi:MULTISPECIES: CYTH and CHAD domain-containing protein [Actinomycetes]|uniref:CYTH and CHAD domain-containing protein n=1 Tax=Actinomycetes TaxID=1760 RepID=UPI0004BF998C|nr:MULTISPECIES: CYTH and CHAD domain-containing protein [Actinomycetes]
MSADEVLEVELKYDLNAGASVPDLTTLDVVHSVSGPVVEHLDATYYDTEALDLASNKITLRRRAGGHDEGWHLKRPAPANSNGRRELHAPLDSVTDASTETQTDHFAAVVPHALADQVDVHVRGRRLIPIATIATVRHITELRDEDDNVLAVLCDDNVTAQSLLPGGHAQSWNEWELELVHGNEKLLKKADKLLRANGARTASSASKLARTIGPTPTGRAHSIGKKPSALELVISELAEHRDHLIAQDPLVRENAPDSVHQMRVATRRARSVLQSFPHVLSADTAEHLGGELKHLAAVLGEARDAEVQLERNEHLLENEKASESIVTALIDDQRETHRIALELAIDFLRSKRYFELLEELDRTIAEPEAGEDAELTAADALDHAVKRSAKRVEKAQRKLEELTDGTPEWVEQLHTIRKRAKQLRYSAESGEQLQSNKHRKVAKVAKGEQSVLGDFHDAEVSREHLASLASASAVTPADAFVYGRLDAREESAAKAALAEYDKIRSAR